MFVCTLCMHADSADLCLDSSAMHATEYLESVILAFVKFFLPKLIFAGSHFHAIFVFREM